MTFVAQPYERFADDLLTALTGGVIREEHRFIDRTPYSLATDDALESTIKVYGQRGEAFALFDLGIDYVYDAANKAIVWKEQGRLPDDHSYFYVNYYRQEGTPNLTDRNPGSVTTTLAEAFARELAVLHKQMEGIYQSAFVETATGAALDQVVALLGLTRKDAKFATGEAVFKRSTPAAGDISIPAGTLVSTDQGQNFETTDRRTLRKGQLAVAVPIRAQVEGPAGKVDAGAIKNINRPLFGIETIVNEAATFFANQKESDEELRRRMQGTLERAGKASLDAIKYALIEDIPEITEANIQLIERAEVAGFVEVKLGLESAGDADLVRRIEETIFYARPAGVRVAHNLPTQSQTGGAGAGITRDQAAADFADQHIPVKAEQPKADVLAKMPEGVLDLQIEVFLRLAQANLSAAQKEAIEEDVRAIIHEYVGILPMGAPLIYNKLLGRIVQRETILDASMLVGAANGSQFEGYTTNLDTVGRKARIDNAHIFVGLVDEIVNISVTVTLEAKAGTSIDFGQVRPLLQEGGTFYQAIRSTVETQLAAAKGALTRGALEAAIRSVVGALESPLQLIDAQGVILSAEYVETGRLLNNTDQVSLQENERPLLAKDKATAKDRLTLKLQDTLNG